MKTYRRKHTVEAMRWTDTDEDRELFTAWFESHDAMFETLGPVAILPNLVTRDNQDDNRVVPGEWVLWIDGDFGGEFLAMADEQFRAAYEEVP